MTTKKTKAATASAKQFEDALEVGKKFVEQAIKAPTEGYEQTLTVTKE